MVALTIEARDGVTNGRAGRLHTAHGDVRTPAFVPLATKATVKGLLPAEVKALGYDMVLGNTFHLMLNPGGELIERLGGLHGFMDWDGPIVTDSGGFQVFSMGHGTVADEIKSRSSRAGSWDAVGRGDAGGAEAGSAEGLAEAGRAGKHAKAGREGAARDAAGREGAILSIDERGVRFRSYVDGSERFLSPEGSMQVQASLGSDIALVFDECTPFHVDRGYTERSTERTHRWLTRCLEWHTEHGPSGQLVYGIVQGGVYEDMRRASARTVASSGCDGVAIGGSLGAEKAQMYEVVGYAVAELDGEHERLPRHLLGIGEVDDLIRGVELGIDTFDCAMPTRLGRHGTALVPEPENRWRVDLTKSMWRTSEEPLMEGCACHACARGLSRAYLSYLARSRELTGMRLLTEHNLAFIARLMADLRGAILCGQLAEVAARLRAGR
ncbi:MAG TPA: tRNA guanosine(34) transglycosylase Tgt [Solirubrobacteraceae bacterium]|nr:tRNA guanosine(34) transglycosylase Tgt [Solirubrobacteraceae bacterium]